MRKYITTFFFMLIAGVLISGCGKSNAQTEQKDLPQAVAPKIQGKILYNWKGYAGGKGKGGGYCIFDNGKILKSLPKTSYATWIEKNKMLVIHSLVENDYKELAVKPFEIINAEPNVVLSRGKVPLQFTSPKLFARDKKMIGQIYEQKNGEYVQNLIIYDLDTEAVRRITTITDSKWSILGFDLSPDEQKIVYAYHMGNSLESKIVIMDLLGNQIEEVTSKGGIAPKWSPDGLKVVYTYPYKNETTGRAPVELTLYDLQTKQSRRLTHHGGITSSPAFSPDGKQIVYVLWGAGGRANNLAVINIDGTGFQTLLPEDHIRQGQVSNPDWGE